MESLTVGQCTQERFGIAITTGPARFRSPGWFDTGQTSCTCQGCGGPLWGFRKQYESSGKTYFFWAVVCADCKIALEPREMDDEQRKRLYASSRLRPGPSKPLPEPAPNVVATSPSVNLDEGAVTEGKVQEVAAMLSDALNDLLTSAKEIELASRLADTALIEAVRFASAHATRFDAHLVQFASAFPDLRLALEQLVDIVELLTDEDPPRTREDAISRGASLVDLARRLSPYMVEKRALKESRQLAELAATLPSAAHAALEAAINQRIAALNAGESAAVCSLCRPAARMHVVGGPGRWRWRCRADNHGTLFLTPAQLRALDA